MLGFLGRVEDVVCFWGLSWFIGVGFFICVGDDFVRFFIGFLFLYLEVLLVFGVLLLFYCDLLLRFGFFFCFFFV